MGRPGEADSMQDEQAEQAEQAGSDNAGSSHAPHRLILTRSLGNCIREDPGLAADFTSIMEKLRNEAFEAILSRWLAQQQGQPRPDATDGHHHRHGLTETSRPVTVAGPGVTPNWQGAQVQEKEKAKADKPGYIRSSSAGVPNSSPSPGLDPDRVGSPSRTPSDIEIIQSQERTPAKARQSTGKERHAGTPRRHPLPERRVPGRNQMIGRSGNVMSQTGAPISSRHSRSEGKIKNKHPTENALLSPSNAASSSRRLGGASSSSSSS